ncbi:hypothetical protein [Micromonospora sp. ATCC 39149]|uniref:hypothetical protein n=1 Tax=Micromonospora sp. (strain ATCC 39149 / NRRL 15099 / SCC 1413) TaxID=219305 RepID=UPI001E62781F|nr:hypothetical protein [Micromonospora sp. ATCC 39149]
MPKNSVLPARVNPPTDTPWFDLGLSGGACRARRVRLPDPGKALVGLGLGKHLRGRLAAGRPGGAERRGERRRRNGQRGPEPEHGNGG